MSAPTLQSPDNPNSHHTAIPRVRESFPVRYLVNHGFLCGRILDFGCGHGADVRFLTAAGKDVIGYDPYYLPEWPSGRFDTVLCTYVLNILLPIEQAHALMAVSELVAPDGRAFFTVRRDIARNGFRTHAVHRTQVYQCRVVLPYPSLLLERHCEIYVYEPLRFVGEPNRNCTLCNPHGRYPLITESATVYAVLAEANAAQVRVLVAPKVHRPDPESLPPRVRTAMELVCTRVRDLCSLQGYSGQWTSQTVTTDQHVHFELSMSRN